jgi:hypothetical protein
MYSSKDMNIRNFWLTKETIHLYQKDLHGPT